MKGNIPKTTRTTGQVKFKKSLIQSTLEPLLNWRGMTLKPIYYFPNGPDGYDKCMVLINNLCFLKTLHNQNEFSILRNKTLNWA